MKSVLHVCGGDPLFEGLRCWRYLYSPHMWRWSWSLLGISTSAYVFSTHVEVIPFLSFLAVQKDCILHTCGGDPWIDNFMIHFKKYSPHMWRWSYMQTAYHVQNNVFSTHVEVIPIFQTIQKQIRCILHTCGGDPLAACPLIQLTRYSPHMWRWS